MNKELIKSSNVRSLKCRRDVMLMTVEMWRKAGYLSLNSALDVVEVIRNDYFCSRLKLEDNAK